MNFKNVMSYHKNCLQCEKLIDKKLQEIDFLFCDRDCETIFNSIKEDKCYTLVINGISKIFSTERYIKEYILEKYIIKNDEIEIFYLIDIDIELLIRSIEKNNMKVELIENKKNDYIISDYLFRELTEKELKNKIIFDFFTPVEFIDDKVFNQFINMLLNSNNDFFGNIKTLKNINVKTVLENK